MCWHWQDMWLWAAFPWTWHLPWKRAAGHLMVKRLAPMASWDVTSHRRTVKHGHVQVMIYVSITEAASFSESGPEVFVIEIYTLPLELLRATKYDVPVFYQLSVKSTIKHH